MSLTPQTPESAIAYVLDRLDLILVMTVNPGFGGQAFIPAMLEKIARVRAMIGSRPIHLEVDGGVTPDTAGSLRGGRRRRAGGRLRRLQGRQIRREHRGDPRGGERLRCHPGFGTRHAGSMPSAWRAFRDDQLRHDAGQMSAYTALAFQYGSERRGR